MMTFEEVEKELNRLSSRVTVLEDQLHDEKDGMYARVRDTQHVLGIKCKQIDLIFEMLKEYVRKDQMFFNKK